MRDDEELRLNELQQFRKTSKRLALEAYSHCEVPAGCGGVVLRWRRADDPIGLTFAHYVRGGAEDLQLDGRPVDEQRNAVAPGEHVLSFSVAAPGRAGFVLFRATLNPQIVAARKVAATTADGRWRAALTQPPDGWRLPAFDDSAFMPLVARRVPAPSRPERWLWEWLRDQNIRGLGLPKAATGSWFRPRRIERVWVRWCFRVGAEGFA